MNIRKKLHILSITSFFTSAILFGLNFICYHFTGDDRENGIQFMFTPYHVEKGKPFITDLIGEFAVIMLSVALVSFMIAVIFYGVKTKADWQKEKEERAAKKMNK